MATVTATGIRDGKEVTITAEIDDAEIARRNAATEAQAAVRRASRNPLAGTALLGRLTDAEYVAINAAAQAGLAATPPRAQLARWIEDVRATNLVEPTAAVTAKAALVADGLLTQERADAVFAAA